jgi:ribose/xylose/arabinose/galactoside ABC-type transport system permease subunit
MSNAPVNPTLVTPGTTPKFSLYKWLDLLGPAIALFVIFIFFSVFVRGGRFVSFDNFDTILRQSAVPAIAALGMTFIIISGGIDLSLGSMVALCTVIIAVILKIPHHYVTDPDGKPVPVTWLSLYPAAWPLLAACVGVAAGVFFGFINGLLVTGLRLAPFIVTLGMMMILRGLAKGLANGEAVTPSAQWLNDILFPVENNPQLRWMVFAPGVWVTLIFGVLMAIVLNFARFGRHVIAIGSNENTARLCGISINRNKIIVYTIGGFFGGCAALWFFSRQSQGSPTLANAFELEVIAAVVIGGASLTGGKGSIFGAIVGALIMNVISSGCGQIYIGTFLQRLLRADSPTGLPTFVQEVVTGIIIIIAVLIDKLRQRRNVG